MEAFSKERRDLHAQREAVARVLPAAGSILRAASGEVLIYDEAPAKRHPAWLRAVVLPSGHVREFRGAR